MSTESAWADEIQVLRDQKASFNVPQTPIQGGLDSRSRPTSTHDPFTNDLLESPQSRKRLEDIEAGLRQRNHDLSPTHHLGSKESGPSVPFNHGREITPLPPSPVPTEVDGEVEEQPQKTYSFLGLHYDTPDITTSALKDEGRPFTPNKQCRISPAEGTVIPVEAGALGGGLLVMPPPTTKHFSGKGKEKECKARSPVEIQDQDGPAQYNSCEIVNNGDPQNSLPLFTLPEDTFTSPNASPTPAENMLDYTNGMKARVKGLLEYMDSFDVTQAAKLLQTVERQKFQYEYRDRSQKMRIEELVAEVSGLKEALQRSEDSNRTKDVEIAALRGGV